MRRRTYLGALAGTATAGTLGVTASALADGTSGDGADPPACRSFGHGDGSTTCAGDDGAVTVARSTASVSGGAFVVALANESADAVGVNPYAWTVYRRGDEWTQVAPDPFVTPQRTLDAGESLSWRVAVGDDAGDGVDVGPLDLGSGGYAFVVVAVVGDGRREFVAPFAVE